MVLISHAHFDHFTGISAIHELYPDVEVGAHENVLKLIKNEKVLKIWSKEDREFCANLKMVSRTNFDNLKDIKPLRNGSKIGNLEIIEVPGHSPDSISLYSDEERFVLVSDSLGYHLSSGKNVPMYFYSFKDYIKSIEKIRSLDPKLIGMGHNRILKGDECENYTELAIREAFNLKESIERGLTEEELLNSIYIDELRYYPESTIKTVVKLLIKRSLE
jgi:glyoxylase-like metal-dependent hydrolase (beta-lactamase superfamily II)